MKAQSKLVKVLKVAIAKFIKLIQLGVKKYILSLADAEAQLEAELNRQLYSLTQQSKETGYQFIQRIEKIVYENAVKLQMVTGRTDTFNGISMNIYKRLPHPRKMWVDTELGYLKIDDEGKILVSFRYSNRVLVCPDLETAFTKFEEYHQSTVLKYS